MSPTVPEDVCDAGASNSHIADENGLFLQLEPISEDQNAARALLPIRATKTSLQMLSSHTPHRTAAILFHQMGKKIFFSCMGLTIRTENLNDC